MIAGLHEDVGICISEQQGVSHMITALKKSIIKSAAAAIFLLSSVNASAATVADVAFVIDQSGSMGGEFSWLSSSIATISQSIANAGITARYAVAGYERTFGPADSRNIYSDFSSDINNVITATNSVSTYGGREYSYDAAVAATTGFSWNNNAAKVIILITDEGSPQSGESNTETGVGAIMNNGGFLLNVIALERYRDRWDEAAYSTSSGYLGFFDLDYLRTDAAGFTEDFTEAKVTEIINTPQVPIPAAVWLFGSALMGLLGFARKKQAA
jgi:hypothetical protein